MSQLEERESLQVCASKVLKLLHETLLVVDHLVDIINKNPGTKLPNQDRDLTVGEKTPNTRRQKALVLYEDRRRCNQVFSTKIGSDTHWDVLLSVYISEETDKPLAVTEATRIASVPLTTALRHINNLVAAGLIYRERDVRDKRRTLLKLTALGFDKFDTFF